MTNTDWNEWRLIDADLETVLGILPASESHLYLALNEPGSGELKIPLGSELAGSVASGQFAQCSYRGEVRGGFFVENVSKGQADASEGAGQWVSLSGRGALSLLEDAMVYDDGTTATTRDFTGMTKAAILIALIDEAQARGGLVNLSYDFSAVTDSDGQAWVDSETYKLTVGSSLLDIVRQFARTGIDFDILPGAGAFVLSAYKLGKGTDKSETIYFRTGVNCEEVTSDEHGDKIKNALRVAYKNGYISVEDAVSIFARRRREKLLDVKMAQSTSSATTIGSAEVELSKDPKKSISVKIHDGVGPRAFVDYNLGDYIMLDVQGVETRYRIYGIQPDWVTTQFSKVIVELNSILYENDIQLAQDVSWLMDQWETAHDSNLLEVSYWAALGKQDSDVAKINTMLMVGTKLYVGGSFSKIGGIYCGSIASYDTVTGQWDSLGLGTAYSSIIPSNQNTIYALATDGVNIYAGGFFAKIGGIEAWNVAKWNGSVWSELGGGLYFYDSFFTGHCNSIVVDGTDLYISGLFDNVGVHGGSSTSGLHGVAKYDTSGDIWTDLGDSGITSAHQYLLQDGATLYLGGSVSPYIRKYSSSTWSDVGTGLDGTVLTLLKYGSSILAGGDMTGHIAEWDGSTWSVFGGGLGDTVRGLALRLTDVYAVGDFTDVGNRIAVYSGGGWSVLGTGLNNDAYAVLVSGDDVYVGGIFTTAGDKPVKMAAVYFNNFESLMNYLENASNSFDMGAAIHNAAASAVTDADEFGFWEDVSNALRKITWANIKATLKIYFDGLYVWLTGDQNVAGVKTFTDEINVGGVPPVSGGAGGISQVKDGASIGHVLWTWGTGFSPFLTGIFSRGTKASPTATLLNDILFKLRGRAYDGSVYGNTEVEIRYVADEDHTTGAHGARAEIWTTPNGSTTLTKALTVGSDGVLYDGAGDPIGGGGGGSVNSVTGDGVDNTDPANPVLTFPTPGDIGAMPNVTTTAANDMIVGGSGGSVGTWVKKTLAEIKTILGLGTAAYTASTDYAVAAKGVTNGDSHDHVGGDGGAIAYTSISDTPPRGWEIISDTILGADAANFDLTSIVQTYKHLKLVMNLRGTTAITWDFAFLRFNNDSGANYNDQSTYSVGTATTAGEHLSATQAQCGVYAAASSLSANQAGVGEILIPNYTSTVFKKVATFIGAHFQKLTTGGGVALYGGCEWNSTAAISRITILPTANNFLAGSRVTLYGLS